MASFFSDFGLLWYLEELNKKEFVTFKEFLRQEILQLELKQISWRELKKASREDLGNLLLKHYEEKQTWDITLKIFEKLNRKDLVERAEREMAGHPKLYRDHLKTKFADDGFRPFRISIQDFMKKRLSQDDQDYLENLLLSEGDEIKSQMVLVGGVAGIGKTLLLKKFLLAWSESLVIQSKFSYIFYFCCRDVKQLKTASLAELISREWPTPSAPIEEIVSQPEKLLFIIDSLEVMECDLFEQELELCDNCMETQPINILMSSLLRRKILPQSSLLICATLETFEKIKDVIECTNVNIIKGFRESDINKFFHTLFQDKDRAQELFSVVRENEQLLTVCQVPVLCWMVITCLKNEIAKGRDPVSICRRTTSLYTTYIFDLFIPPSAQYPSKKSQSLLLGLCSLAAEGMWTDTFVFGEEALSRNGIMDSDIPTFLDIGLLGKIRESEKVYIFPHPSVQEVCAALYYLLKSPEDHPSQGGVQSIETLMVTFLTKVKVQWVFFGCFIFGLLQKSEQEKLEMFFGYQLSQKIKDELYQFLETIRGNMELQEEIDGMKWFSCLFEFEDEAFQVQALSCMEQIQFVAKDYSDVIIAAYCVKHCSTLKKLSFSTQNVLIEEREESYMEKFLAYWKDICSVFVRNKDIQVLQMTETDFNEPIFQVLYDSLKSPRFTLKGLMANNVSFFGGDQMFFDLIQNCSLEYLNLSRSVLSHSELETLCDILIQAECHVEKLEVAHCHFLPDDCKKFAFVLMRNKSLKDLNLASNHLGQGILSLCKALCHQDCILECLSLAGCFLSEQCWDHLFEVLRQSKTLRHLDLSFNDLTDEGLRILCKALTLQDCVLESLSMIHCLITSSGCQDLSDVLRNNQNLKCLHVSNNKLGDTGVKLLCDAIKHPNCHLEELGLEDCEITSASDEDLSSAFTQCNTLKMINLNGNYLNFSGIIFSTMC